MDERAEAIANAEARKRLESMREKNRERVRRHRAKKAAQKARDYDMKHVIVDAMLKKGPVQVQTDIAKGRIEIKGQPDMEINKPMAQAKLTGITVQNRPRILMLSEVTRPITARANKPSRCQHCHKLESNLSEAQPGFWVCELCLPKFQDQDQDE